MKIRGLLGTTLALTAIGAALAGCGGSSSSALSRTQIDAKANAICAASAAQIQAVTTPSSFQDANVAAAYFDQILPLTTAATQKLEALKPDGNVSADWNSFITLRKSGLTLLQTITHKADTKDATGLQDLAKAPAVEQQAFAAATKVGATACAQ